MWRCLQISYLTAALQQGQEDYLRAQFPDLEPEQAGFVRRAMSRMAKIAYENRE